MTATTPHDTLAEQPPAAEVRDGLYGRDVELMRIEELLTDACAGISGTLLLVGEPGIGKSALLRYAQSHAGSVRTLRATGVDAESHLPFSGLHQLLLPVLGGLDRVAGPQALALRRAFGLAEGATDNLFLVALATLGLLADAAEENGALCLVDDAHLLDEASADALVSVARRTHREGVAMVFALRDDVPHPFESADLPSLQVPALARSAASALLSSVSGTRTGDDVHERLLDAAQGNPLALHELPASLSDSALHGRDLLPEPIPAGARIQRSFLGRAARLSQAARDLLLLLASSDTRELCTILRAAEVLRIDADVLGELDAERLLIRDGAEITLRHPLLRSAVYASAAAERARRTHLALAQAHGAQGNHERRVWHQAVAAAGDDPGLAGELEGIAEQAARRGAHDVAAAAWERAARLTPQDSTRGKLLIAAAEASWRSGRAERVIATVTRARTLLDDPADQATVARLLGAACLSRGDVRTAFRELISAAQAVATLDPRRTLQLLARAAETSWWAGRLDWAAEVRWVASLISPPTSPSDTSTFALLVGSCAVLDGRFRDAADTLRGALRSAEAEPEPWSLITAGAASIFTGDDVAAHDAYTRAVRLLRQRGALGDMLYPLTMVASIELWQGRSAASTANALEALDLARETHQETEVSYLLGLIAHGEATHGYEERCRRNAGEAVRLASAHGVGLSAANAHRALGRLELAVGRPADAVTHLTLLEAGSEMAHPLVALFATPDLVEAATRAGRTELAEQAYTRFETWTNAMASPWGRTVAPWMRALLCTGAEADAAFDEALRLTLQRRHPFEIARLRLLFGEHLRRTRRLLDARDQLREALGLFEAMRAEPWAQRARSELHASGENAGRVEPHVAVDLTPQELRIARFASEGATNKEIAAQIFVSRRTVEHHLTRIFTKLGVRSRVELVRAFDDLAPPGHGGPLK